MLEPFYFGQYNSCFGHFSPAEGTTQGKSVLIVPSIFGEAIRAHRVTREVAKSLSKKGYDILRFDFDGDGNSCSETSNVTVQDWIRNISDAYHELTRRSKNSSVSLLSVRFGAGLSLAALRSHPLHSVVMWDPILSNQEMYDTFIGTELNSVVNEPKYSKDPFETRLELDGMFEMGLGKDFATGFLHINEMPLPSCDVQIIGTDAYEQSQIINTTKVNYHCDWEKKDLPVIFAPKLISTICEYF